MVRFLMVIGTIILVIHSGESVVHSNPFDAIKGCLQYDHVPGYDDVQLYFPTNRFRNIVHTPHSRILRIGIVGKNDGIIRYGKYPFPYDLTVVEIVVSGWANTRSAGRLQTRRLDNTVRNEVLKEAATPRLLSASRPLVFKLEVFNDGLVQLTRDGEIRPFFDFKSPKSSIAPEYIAFTKWDADVIFFYDCPIEELQKRDIVHDGN